MKLLSILAASAALSVGLPALAQGQSDSAPGKAAIQIPAVAGEIANDLIVKATDNDLSCTQLRSEVRALTAVVSRREQAAERAQAGSFDRAAMAQAANKTQAEAIAAEKRSRDFTIAQRSEKQPAITPAMVAKAAANASPGSPPTREGLPVSEPFMTPAEPSVTPTQIRQMRLLEILYHKGC